MPSHFADKLLHAIDERGTCACVGIDPVYEHLPREIRTSEADRGDRGTIALVIEAFCREIIDVVAKHVSIVKVNVAFFEAYRGAGMDAYHNVLHHAHHRGLLVIGDIKRGDIGHSSEAYAAAHLVGDGSADLAIPDAVTISGYLGIDGVEPFIHAAKETGRGVFVLVHTSNPSAAQLQHLPLESGRLVTEELAALVHRWGRDSVGEMGYSLVGAVAAPGNVELARLLRRVMPNTLFLVPGFGAQGRSLEQVAACFDEQGKGAIVNASRSVIYAFDGQSEKRWQNSVERACIEFIGALKQIPSSG